jgi:hypothetical protein
MSSKKNCQSTTFDTGTALARASPDAIVSGSNSYIIKYAREADIQRHTDIRKPLTVSTYHGWRSPQQRRTGDEKIGIPHTLNWTLSDAAEDPLKAEFCFEARCACDMSFERLENELSQTSRQSVLELKSDVGAPVNPLSQI